MPTGREEEEWQERHVAPCVADDRRPRILSSPPVRALATAAILAETLGVARVEVWLELRELFGLTHRGFGRADLQRRFPNAVLPDTIRDDGWEHGDPSPEAVRQRAERVIAMLGERVGCGKYV